MDTTISLRAGRPAAAHKYAAKYFRTSSSLSSGICIDGRLVNRTLGKRSGEHYQGLITDLSRGMLFRNKKSAERFINNAYATANISRGNPLLPPELFSTAEKKQMLQKCRNAFNAYFDAPKNVKTSLLRPDIIAVFAGVKPAYIRCEENDIEGLFRTAAQDPDVFGSLEILFCGNYIISVPAFLERLAGPDSKMLTETGIMSEQQIKGLKDDLYAKENLEQFADTLCTHYYREDTRHVLNGFLMGFLPEDIALLMKNKTLGKAMPGSLPYISTPHGFYMVTKGGSLQYAMIARWEAAANYALSLFCQNSSYLSAAGQTTLGVLNHYRAGFAIRIGLHRPEI